MLVRLFNFIRNLSFSQGNFNQNLNCFSHAPIMSYNSGLRKNYFFSFYLFTKMIKTQRQLTYHEMEMMIQAAATVLLKKDLYVIVTTNLFLDLIRLQLLLFGYSFIQISQKNWIKHLLCAITFLKQYSSDQVLSQATECTPKTFIKSVLVLTVLNTRYNDKVCKNLNLTF